MSRFTIYSTTGTAKTEIEVLELHDEWMAECFVTVTVKSEEPIDFVIGDYIIYRDEKYAIDYDPTVIKKARRGSYGEGFVYDNIKFAHDAQSKIVRCDFTDIVLSPDSETNKIHYSSLPTFPFYCASVDDLLDRVQACLEELYPGQFVIIGLNSIRNKERGQAVGRRQEFIDAYKKYIDPAYIPSGQEATDPYGKQDVAETVDNISCWDALVKIHDDFDLNFIQRGNVIVAGTNGALTASTFRYGKGNGLYELERISDSSKQIVTRLRGYGNEKNLPSRYYATLNMQVFANALVAATGMVTVNLKYRTDYFLEVSPAGESILTTKIGDTEYPNSAVRINGLDGNVIVDTRTSVPIAAGTKIYFLDGVKKDAFPTENRDYSTNNLPDNMAVSRLMLPGFPNQSLADWVEAHKDDEDKDWLRAAITAGFEFSTNQYRPYIDSPNKEEYEIRPASIYFDGSDETDDIYPTIEEMEYQGHRIDQVVEAEQITDNGVFTKEGDIPNFKITLPDLGFNLLEYYEDGASIDMKSGMCGARSFEFAKKPTRDAQTGHWICTVKRVHDDALDLWFPYNDFQIRPNDKYVLIGIDMPDAYVSAASVKLLKASLEALDENDEPQYTYQPRIDEIWMQRQHNTALDSAITSIHDTIKAGDIFQFEDADLGVSDGIIIDVLTIKENGNNGIPTYEVTLRNEKQVSTIQKAVEKAVSGSSAASGSAGGYSGRQVFNAIESYGSDFFLSKNTDDVASGEIGFLKGLWIKVKGLFGIDENGDALLRNADMSGQVHVGEDLKVEGDIYGITAVLDKIISSEYTGDGMMDTGFLLQYADGKAKLVVDDLVARGKFTVNELESRIWTYTGGNMVFSGAGSTIFFVEYLDANDNILGYTNINAPWLLAGRPLLSSMVAWSKRRTVQRTLTDTEKAQVAKFRCYEYSDNGTMQTRNWWHTDDLAFCQTLNHVKDKVNSDGSYSGSLSNTVYHRLVKKVGTSQIAALDDGQFYDYVELSNISGEYDPTYNDWPAAGDTIVQRGNRTDTSRRSMVTIEVSGDTRGLKVYDKIMGWYANTAQGEQKNGIRYTYIGYDENTGRAKLEVFGDAYIGSKDRTTTYVYYNEATGTLEIKAKINALSTMSYNGTDTTLQNIFSGIDQQIDKKIETWRQDDDPADDWYDATQTPVYDVRAQHVGDVWMDTSSTGGKVTKIYVDKGVGANPRYDWENQDVPEVVFDDIDKKAAVYAAWGDWGDDLNLRDLLIPAADFTQGGVAYKRGKMYRCTQLTPSIVFTEVEYTDDSALHTYVGAILNKTWASGDDVVAATAQRAILGAMGGGTIVDGGLLLTSLIGMRKFNGQPGQEDDPTKYTTWGGISGMYDDWSGSTQPKGHGIAAWFGGAMFDKEDVETLPSSYAKTLFRFDGTGYMADGNISWNADGSGNVAGGNISWNAAGDVTIQGTVVNATTKIDTPAIFLNGTDITATLNAILDMFEKDTTTEPGTTLIKAKYSLYSVGDVSALGASSSGGGGGGGGASVLYELNDVLSNAERTSVLDAQEGYVLTCVTNGGVLKWKAAPTAPTYVLPAATSGALGGIKIGYTDATVGTRNYAVALDNDGKAYVNVPWTDHYDYIAPKSEITYNVNYLQYDDVYATEASNPANAIGNPTADWYHHIIMNHANAGGYFVDMALCFHSNDFYYRRIANGVANDWVRVLDSSNYSSYALQKIGGTLTGALTINPSNTSSFQDGIILNDKGGGASEALTIKWTSASYTTGVKLSADLANNYLIFHDGTDWRTIYHSGNNPFIIRGELADAYINGTTYSTLDNGTYLHTYTGASETIIHFQRSNCSASGLDIRFKYPQDSSNPLQYRKCIDSNRFASTDWVTLIDSLNIGSQSVNYATSAGSATTAGNVTGTVAIANGGTGSTTAADARANLGTWALISDSYPTLMLSNGSTNNWIKIGTANTSYGLIPSQSGGAGSGHNYIGTDSWYWKYLYVDEVHSTKCEIYGTTPSVHVGTSSAARISLHWSSDNNRGLYDYSGYWVIGAKTNTFLMRGNVGIGTTSPSYKLHVSGDIYATGDVTAASDERQKCDIEQIDLSVEQIANAPAVKFSWKDGRDNLRHAGSFAQYWQNVLPESVTDKNDILGLNYGSAALVSVVKVAKKVLTHEEEIEQLKKRVRELEHEVEQLKTA